MKTYSTKAGDIERKWHVIDASDKTLGRMSSQVAKLLMGKHKPQYVPYLDTGDYVIVLNASKIIVTGNKARQKNYYRHSGCSRPERQRQYCLRSQSDRLEI